ncbi:MAG: ADP-ribosylation factor-like protein [Polyangiales bacterium]
MAVYDPSRGAVTVRVVYDGLGTAGKTTNIRQIHALFTLARQGDVVVPEEHRGRTLFFDWLELDAGYVDEHRLRMQVLTVPGQFVYAPRRWALLRDPDAVVEVCDSSPAGVERSRYAMRFLRALLARQGSDVPVIVQANKQDVPGALSGEALRAALELDADARVVEATAHDGGGVRSTLVFALLAARERARAQIARVGVGGLPRVTESAEEIYARMRAVEEAGGLEEGAAIVESLLREDAAG